MSNALTSRPHLSWLLASVLAAAGAGAQKPAPSIDRTTLRLREFSIELKATWERLTDTVYKFEKNPLVADLKPAIDRARYDAARFRPFLPEEPVAVGDVWRIDAGDVLPFLRQFHRGATKNLHHDAGFGISAHGAWACLRAFGPRYAEVLLRVHADFLLKGDGTRRSSSWFTPAQFAGRMVIDHKLGTVVAFTLGVPKQSANVDINIAKEGRVLADIGRIPRMDLVGGQDTAELFGADTRKISVSAAENALACKFYPFAKIPWLDLDKARAESLATGKPLHVVALFGSLMDESC